MTRGGKEGNNAFLNDYDLVNNWKLDFINGLIKKDNNQALFSLMKVIGYKNPDFVHYNRRQQKKMVVDESKFDNETNLFKAVSAGRRDIAGYILKNMIGQSGYGFNPLHLEMLEVDDETKIEIKFKPSVNKKSNYQVTPVHFACINPNEKILKKLVENDNGGDIHYQDINLKKPIHYAAACSGTGPLKYLLEVKNCTADEPDKTKMTPLMVAAKYGRLDNVKLLLERGADLNRKQGTGQDNAFIIAAKNGQVEVVKYLIEKMKVDVNSVGKDRLSALHHSAMTGNEKLLGYLVIKGANINLKDKLARTPLILASKSGNSRIVEILLRLKAKINQGDSSNNTPLHYACAYGWLEIAIKLIEAGGDINMTNSWKSSPLEITILKNHFGILKYILEKVSSIDINAKFDNGNTLLLHFLNKITPKTVEGINYLVVEKNADVTLTDDNKISPLHLLAKFNFKRYLDGFYPSWKKPYKKDMLEEDFKEKRYVVENEDFLRREHRTLLRKVLDVFLAQNIDINAVDSRGCPPIFWAICNKNLAMIELLLEQSEVNLVFKNMRKLS